MKNRIPIITNCLIGAGLLAVATFVSVGQKSLAASPPTDPAHAAHVQAGTMTPDTAKGDPALLQQLSQLQAKVAQLEAALAKGVTPMAAAPAGAAMPGMPGAVPAASPPMKMGMMDKMMPMAGGAKPMMDDDMMEMARMGGAMPPASPMSGGGMGMMAMDKMEMANMMGMGGMGSGAAGVMPQSALPGFPGASHLYHIGATSFFLDHLQHIALTTEQQAALNKAKEQALLAKNTADRAVEQAEQVLWTLTAADQPDAAKIEAKIAEIGKLSGDKRLAFIRAVGEASKLLTDEQRKILTGFAPPAPANSMTAPAAAMPAGGMPDM